MRIPDAFCCYYHLYPQRIARETSDITLSLTARCASICCFIDAFHVHAHTESYAEPSHAAGGDDKTRDRIAGSQARGIIKDSHKIERRAYRYAVCSHVVILSSSLVLLSTTISPPATSSSSSACCFGSSLSSACTERGGRGGYCSCARGGLSARSRRPGSCGRRPSV